MRDFMFLQYQIEQVERCIRILYDYGSAGLGGALDPDYHLSINTLETTRDEMKCVLADWKKLFLVREDLIEVLKKIIDKASISSRIRHLEARNRALDLCIKALWKNEIGSYHYNKKGIELLEEIQVETNIKIKELQNGYNNPA